MAKRLKGALCLGVQKALGIVSTHYIVDIEQLATGYIIPDGDDDAKVDAMEQADAAAEGAAFVLAELFESELLPGAMDDEDEGARGGEGHFIDSLGPGTQVDKLGLCLDFIFLSKGTKT